mgnify:FL=1
MSVPLRFVWHQGAVLSAFARTALGAARSGRHREMQVPGRWIEAEVDPLPSALLDAYIRHVGGDPASYRGQVPPHLFPQWVFPLQVRALQDVTYPMQKVLNAGAGMTLRGPIPRGEPLRVRTRLDSVDDDGRRALLSFVAHTGTAAEPELLEARLQAFVPLGGGEKREKSEPARVPGEAREIGRWRLDPGAGLDCAKLTGDFNPVHWVPAWARALGFRNVILHGFSTYARAYEALVRARFAGAAGRLRTYEARFTKPLVLPASPGVFVDGDRVTVGMAPSAPAFMTGTYGV